MELGNGVEKKTDDGHFAETLIYGVCPSFAQVMELLSGLQFDVEQKDENTIFAVILSSTVERHL
jgi:hypothetical protein